MLILHEKEKAYNAIKFFLENTSMCGRKKLYKLLYALDFEHFEKTGRTVTGYTYKAWRMGPVPVELDKEIKSDDKDFFEHFKSYTEEVGQYERQCLEARTPFDERVFSRRELDILHNLAERFESNTGDEMELWTHREGTPWQTVYEVENRPNEAIPLEYQLRNLPEDEEEVVIEAARERNAIIAHYQ